MKIIKRVSVVKNEVSDIICNMCGEKILKDKYGNFSDYLNIEKKWGYLSKCDSITHSFDICESCYYKLIDSFKVDIDIE